MSGFARRCGRDGPAREAACRALLQRLGDGTLHTVRVVWCDLHGGLRGKWLPVSAVADALDSGVGLVATLLLKDTADRTALPVFDPAAASRLPIGAQAGNLRLLPDPSTLQPLPWAPGTAWLRAEPFTDNGLPVALDTRGLLCRQLDTLGARGFGLRCGLEVEFHVYRRVAAADGSDPSVDPTASAWPPPAPLVALVHGGYRLLDDGLADRVAPVFDIVRGVADGLGLPLRSLEIELGPSQVEAVFDPCDALQAADRMVAFRHGVRQALARAGWLASFMCRPPFAGAVASGWHLHQSLVPLDAAAEAACAPVAAAPDDAARWLGTAGAAWLAGLLHHAGGLAAFTSPTISGYSRLQGGPMSPLQAVWGLDNRGAMLRLLPDAAGGGHLENRLGEPAANPYLALAAQVAAGIDGMDRALTPPPACTDPYARVDAAAPGRLPATLAGALQQVENDPLWAASFGDAFVSIYDAVKRAEWARHDAAADRDDWLLREYFDR